MPRKAAPRPSRQAARRAAAERESALRAMQERQRRGLLSHAEETLLAERMAELAQELGGRKTGEPAPCTIS